MFFFYNYDHLLNHLFVKFNWPTRHSHTSENYSFIGNIQRDILNPLKTAKMERFEKIVND